MSEDQNHLWHIELHIELDAMRAQLRYALDNPRLALLEGEWEA